MLFENAQRVGCPAMFATSDLRNVTKAELYRGLATQCQALIAGETDPIANMANCAALIFNSVPRLNWAGFYLLKGGELVLGPFQGQPACVRIALGRGICGTAAENRSTLRVPDVTKFPGHIACDAASRSEVVVPMVTEDSHLIGVLDVDSPELDRFDAEDEAGLSAIAEIIARAI
jgi:GAF domain-containing protein